MAIRILDESIGLIACNVASDEYQSSGSVIMAAHCLMRRARSSVIMEQLDVRRRTTRCQVDYINNRSWHAIQVRLLDALIQ